MVLNGAGKICAIANDSGNDKLFIKHYPELVEGFANVTDFLAYDALIR